jgi:hypothetical protein
VISSEPFSVSSSHEFDFFSESWLLYERSIAPKGGVVFVEAQFRPAAALEFVWSERRYFR